MTLVSFFWLGTTESVLAASRPLGMKNALSLVSYNSGPFQVFGFSTVPYFFLGEECREGRERMAG